MCIIEEVFMSTVVLSELSWRDRVRKAILVGMAVFGEMPFLDHLEELRSRLIKCLIALAVATMIGFAYTAQIIDFLMKPAAITKIDVVAIEAFEVFSLYLKVALATGVCLAA